MPASRPALSSPSGTASRRRRWQARRGTGSTGPAAPVSSAASIATRALAASMRVGRPDLAREYDDGGLVDINSVPPEELQRYAGMSPAKRPRCSERAESWAGSACAERAGGLPHLPQGTLARLRRSQCSSSSAYRSAARARPGPASSGSRGCCPGPSRVRLGQLLPVDEKRVCPASPGPSGRTPRHPLRSRSLTHRSCSLRASCSICSAERGPAPRGAHAAGPTAAAPPRAPRRSHGRRPGWTP